jgi:phosphopentomutase
MARGILLVLDSVGCGAAPDAAAYGDLGADTLGHIADWCAEARHGRDGGPTGTLRLPHLAALGLGAAARSATGRLLPGLSAPAPRASFGHAIARSAGKDTPSGHWEMAGTPVLRPWGSFPQTIPCLPPALVAAVCAEAGLPGILGDRHASGTAVIEAFGQAHIESGKPICYTSADSVLQIAAHEEAFGLNRLYALCKIARRLCDPLAIGRVIARPFVGRGRQDFRRTSHRKDFAMPPPEGTILARAAEAGRPVVSIGKVGDIFAHRHTGEELKGDGNSANLDLLSASLASLPEGGLAFVNLVDFDTDYGHRRDVAGYAACLEAFDARLPDLLARLAPEDLLIITADHGNDPTFQGTDHTREMVPILSYCPSLPPVRLGRRTSLADIGATLAAHLGLLAPSTGTSWL